MCASIEEAEFYAGSGEDTAYQGREKEQVVLTDHEGREDAAGKVGG